MTKAKSNRKRAIFFYRYYNNYPKPLEPKLDTTNFWLFNRLDMSQLSGILVNLEGYNVVGHLASNRTPPLDQRGTKPFLFT
jgi:hypothetical protein